MIVFCWIIGIILCIISVIGSILPGLPGPQLAYLAIILAQILLQHPFSWSFIMLWGCVIVILMILDYYLPILGTKKLGGSKRGNYGCTIGMIIGVFFGAIGVILYPFIGALIGELIHKNDITLAIKSAFGSFVGLASGILLKLIVSIILSIYFCIGCYNV